MKRRPGPLSSRSCTSESAARLLTTYDFVTILLVTGLVFGVVMVFSAGYYSTTNLSKPDPYYFLKKRESLRSWGSSLCSLWHGGIITSVRNTINSICTFPYSSLVLVLTPVGRNVNGATRWIYIGPVRTSRQVRYAQRWL